MADTHAEFKYLLSLGATGESAAVKVCSLDLPRRPAASTGFAELHVTAQLFGEGRPLHPGTISTTNPARGDGSTIRWDNRLEFPVKLSDVGRNTVLALTVWSVGERPVGGTTVRLFDDNGVLLAGVQRLRLWPGVEADGRGEATPGAAEPLAADDPFRLDQLRERYEAARVRRVEWLDRLSFRQMGAIEQAALAEHEAEELPEGWDEHTLVAGGFLTLEFPSFGYPVVYEERAYPGTPLPRVNYDLAEHPWEAGLMVVQDPEAGADSPVEHKYRRLARDLLRGVIDPDLKPNRQERERIDQLLASPSDALRPEDKDLLWKFRYSLTDNRKALTKVLLSVDWTVEQEVREATDLLGQWAEKAPIDVADALKLLGPQREFKNDVVRRFAVDTLAGASDEELLAYLLQLVQALRYEPQGRLVISSSSSSSGEGEGEGQGNAEDNQADSQADDQTDADEPRELPPLAQFLIDRAVNSLRLANFFFWYLQVELEDAQHGHVFRAVFAAFRRAMQSREESSAIQQNLEAQSNFMGAISTLQRRARDEKGRKDQKEEKLRQFLGSELPPLGEGVEYVCLPVDPAVRVTSVNPQSTFMFKSALYPAVVEFNLHASSGTPGAPPAADDAAGGGGAAEVPDELSEEERQRLERNAAKAARIFGVDDEAAAPPTYKVVFKSGDDLRQDQLVIQMFSLMDQLLKRVNLDLRLTPYRVLATGPADGLMEFVSGSKPVSWVLANYDSILDFFRESYPDPTSEGTYGVVPEVFNTYIKSCAGYCVVTFLLGIGDRHLDNIMLMPDGHLLHIDFGFTFGKDPKPYPAPFRLTKEMVEAMGGFDSTGYARFQSYACQAYVWLRKSANLILNLLNLMVDAGIEDLSSDPVAALNLVETRFRLDLNEEQAEAYYRKLIGDSVSALFPVLMEMIHRGAVRLR